MAQNSYWKSYRRIQSNVRKHISLIYTSDRCIDENSENRDDICSQIETRHMANSTPESELNSCVDIIDQNVNVDEGLGPINIHAEVIDEDLEQILAINNQVEVVDELCDSVSVCSETLSTSSISSTDSEFIDDDEFLDVLRIWAAKFDITHSALQSLLAILRPYHTELPKDPRTLLKTTTNYAVVAITGGSYYHFGIKDCILKEIMSSRTISVQDTGLVRMQINIDGLPLFKSSGTQFWPILGMLEEPYQSGPFVIGLFLGEKKPGNVHEFLQDFVDEMNILHETGISVPNTNHSFSVEISAVICDAPARAFVKQIKSHSGYSGCDKCTQAGRWLQKMTFPENNAPLRTDLSFNEMEDAQHHHGPSPLRGLPLGMVTQFPLDYMHLVCLGVMKRLLWLWMRAPGGARQGEGFIRCISDRLNGLKQFLPREFLRKGRTLYEVERWKASEFRQFLIYTGPVVLKNRLPARLYKHFRLFSVAIFCLVSPFFYQVYGDYAKQLLVQFVTEFAELYGENQIVYNVHCLVHIADDVARFGALDHLSAFPFESFLGKLKRLIRKPNFPLQQVIRRLSERYPFICSNNVGNIPLHGIVKKKHRRGPCPLDYITYLQFEQLSLPDSHLSVHRPDNCIIVREKVGLIRNILSKSEDDGDRVLVVEWFRGVPDSFFEEPLHSSDLRIFKVHHLVDDIAMVDVQEVTSKCVLLPCMDYYVVVPLVHNFS